MNAYEARKMANDYYLNKIYSDIEDIASQGYYDFSTPLKRFIKCKPEIVVNELIEDGYKLRFLIDENFDYWGVIDDFNQEDRKFQPININSLDDYNNALMVIDEYAKKYELEDFAQKWARIQISW